MPDEQSWASSFQLLFANNPLPMWVYDLQTLRFLEVNEAAIVYYGYTREEFLNMTLADIRPPEDVPRLLDDVARERPALQFSGQWRHRRKDGTVFDVEIVSHTLEYAGRAAVLVVAQDVTERRRTEAALRQRKAEFRTLVEHSPDLIAHVDRQLRHLYVNPALERATGIPPDHYTGKTNREAGMPTFLAAIWDEALEQVFATGQERTLEYSIEKEGERLYFQARVVPVPSPQNPAETALVVVRDVTDLKRAQEALQQERDLLNTIMTASPIAITLVDREGRITFANPRAELLLGLSRDEITHQTYNSPVWRITDYDGNPFPEEQLPFVRVMATGQPVFNVRHAITWPNGRRVYLSINGMPLFDANGRVSGMVAAFEDVTERVQIERSLRYYAERLRVLHDIDQALLNMSSLAHTAQQVLEHLSRLIPCQRLSVALFDKELEQANLIAVWPAEGTTVPAGTRLPLTLFPDIMETLQRGEVFVGTSMAEMAKRSSPVAEALHQQQLNTFLTLPIFNQEGLIGSLNLLSETPGVLTTEHIEIGLQVATQLGVAFEQARLNQHLWTANERLRRLSQQLVSAQEAERRRIARELHDDIGQSLTALKITLQVGQQMRNSEALRAHLQDSIELVEQALQSVRALSVALRPALLDDLGLIPALRWLLNQQAQLGRFTGTFIADPPEMSLSPDLETTCFRIAQEALSNVVRHAQASHVAVELYRRDRHLELNIRDDGIGFDATAMLENAKAGRSLGILSLQDRATLFNGQLTIVSAPGQGTEVRAIFPLHQVESGL